MLENCLYWNYDTWGCRLRKAERKQHLKIVLFWKQVKRYTKSLKYHKGILLSTGQQPLTNGVKVEESQFETKLKANDGSAYQAVTLSTASCDMLKALTRQTFHNKLNWQFIVTRCRLCDKLKILFKKDYTIKHRATIKLLTTIYAYARQRGEIILKNEKNITVKMGHSYQKIRSTQH